ncbi:MAG TPA: hemolysin family protein [Rhizomicrobium sp.]|nr:hemolysin family protein [Rhizomicrobium sp.]
MTASKAMSGALAPGSETDESASLLKRVARLLRGRRASSAIRESLEEVIEESERQSPALSAQERTLLANLLRAGELKISDVMVPRADIVAVDESTPLSSLLMLFGEAQHSRLPVYRETLDDPVGLVHLKDVLGLIEPLDNDRFRWRGDSIAQIRRPILFVAPSMPVLDLLVKMRTAHIQLALVIDEYGGTDGLVSIEDLIEEIVGDISDEHDVDAAPVRRDESGAYVADARVDLDDFRDQTNFSLSLDDEAAQEVDTLGGLVTYLLGRVPQRGEIVAHPAGYEFEVLEADPRRVKRLRIRPPAAAPDKSP